VKFTFPLISTWPLDSDLPALGRKAEEERLGTKENFKSKKEKIF